MKQLAGPSLVVGNEGTTNKTNLPRRDLTKGRFLEKWRQAAEQYRRYDARVSAAAIINDILSDLESVERLEQSDRLTLAEAASESGLSAEHLGKLVRTGRLPNAGRKGAPRIQRLDLPHKVGYPATQRRLGVNREQVARVAIAPYVGGGDG